MRRIRFMAGMGIAVLATLGCSPSADDGPHDGTVEGDVGEDGGGETLPDGMDGEGSPDDADVPEGCVPAPESCDGLDNDCDGLTDEDFDLFSDAANCGECGATCDPDHAAGVCDGGLCIITACDPGWTDANRSPVDGCEYACTATAETESEASGNCTDGADNDCDTAIDEDDPGCAPCVPEFCDGLDNDCDGLTDEDFDLGFRPEHCGACNNVCRDWSHATGVCVFGECQYVCDAGYADTNGLRSDGCEAICVPTGRLEVLCDGVDDDCDGETDEDFTVTFCGEGFCRRLSVCFRGEERCEARTPPIATDVTCDRVDDDCDGAVDDDAFCPCYADSECDDGNPCNGVETCTIGVGCNTGTPMECDDAVSCTDDTCNPLTRLCEHTALDALCDDGNPCNGGETCDARAGCMVGTPVNCDDRIACTDDACDTRTGACSHTPIHSACQDGVFCNGAESCDTVRGCISGAAPSCSDGILCTDDVCSAATDSCQNTPIHGRCDDSQYCNGTERCEAGRGCVSGAVPACDDGIGCTADACDPTAAGGTGACRNTPPDVDGDGFPPISCLGTDCNDSNRFVYPGATETCNAVDDDCDGATDETFACVQNSSGACTVGACSGVRVCSASCSWGTCTVLSTESCNAIDDNCNGATDEGFSCVYNTTQGCTVVRPTKTCSGLQTCAGPSCTWTGCVVPETGGYIETCNGIDDDCDTTVDDAPTPPNVLCTARPNATVNCASASCVLSCNSGWYDTNGVVTDGCECAIESPEASSTCGTASRDLGTFYDSGTDVTVSGKIHVAGDVDCYRFVANDSADTTCDAFNVDIRFTANPSSQFEFSVYRGACSTQVCASTIDGYSWYTDFRSGSGTSALGECGCRTTSTYLYNRCTDNGATFYFCVSRRSSYAVSCETYTIRVTNGVY